MSKRHIVELNFSDEGYKELKELEKEMGVSQLELFKRAIRWIQWTTEELNKGGRFYVKDSGGKIREVVASFLRKKS